jgi:hypothetical protein
MDRFWELAWVLRNEVYQFRFGYGRTNGVQDAASEFFRKPYADDFGPNFRSAEPTYTLDEAIQLAKTWRHVTRDLYDPLFDVVEGRSDDAYGDLLDALPLAGRDVVQKALDREFGNNIQFERAVCDVCQARGQGKMADLILHGENYVATALYDAASRFFAIQSDQGPTTSTPTSVTAAGSSQEPTMWFEPWKCPECGHPAKGMLEMVPGLTRLLFDADGDAEYDGGVDLCWDGQTVMRDEQGRVTLECCEGHQWQAVPPEYSFAAPAGTAQ